MADNYYPEGSMPDPDYANCFSGAAQLLRAKETGKIMEAPVISCDKDKNLIVSFGEGNDYRGFIPRDETAVGVATGQTREIAIISRVNKYVCFKVISVDTEKKIAVLSRRLAQEEALEYFIRKLGPGMIIPAVITHLEPFGCFCDIGCGIISMISIENISVSRISHPSDRFAVGQRIFAVVRGVDAHTMRVYLSHKELLGTWRENADRFTVGETVGGIVRSVEEYGVFVELAPNLAGLAEYKEELFPGQLVSVYIKNIIPEKMKIKLAIIDSFPVKAPRGEMKYFITEGRLRRFRYSPDEDGRRIIETRFDLY